MNLSVYMETLAYRYGGAEAYAACIIESLQKAFPEAKIHLITEHLRGRKRIDVNQMVQMQNDAYGTSISSDNVCIDYFNFVSVNEQTAKNKISRLLKIFQREIYENRRFHSIRKLTQNSDLFINCSRNILGGLAKKNICIIHFPKAPCSGSGINNRIGYFRKKANLRDSAFQKTYDLYLPNSQFTAGHLRSMWGIPEEKTKVLYPPVKLVEKQETKNKNQILICSRICQLKKIDILLKGLTSSRYLNSEAKIIVAGSVIGEDESFVKKLKIDFPNVFFSCNPSRSELETLYSQSELFVHAMGFGEDSPQNFEHFGITTVEAMSAGCIPVVINKGGQKEIVTEGSGFRWDTIDELIEKTEWIIKNREESEKIRTVSIARSKIFCKETFFENFVNIVSEIIHV